MAPLVAVGDRIEAGCLVAKSSNNDSWYRCSHAPLRAVVADNGDVTNGYSTNGHPANGSSEKRPAANGKPKNGHAANHPSNRTHAVARYLELAVEGHSIAHGKSGCYNPAELAPKDIVDIARRAGLVGMGGGMYPTYLKLRPKKPIDWVIINGCESEPYLTCDHRVLVEHRDEVECGMHLAMRAVGATEGTIVTAEDDYLDGYEPRLVQKVLGRQIPKGGRPSDVGVIVMNVQTARTLHQAVCERRPLTERVVTVDGNAIQRPGNYVVPIGTEIRHVLDVCGVDWDQSPTVIAGGPIMGSPVSPETTVTAGTGGILALSSDEISKPSYDPCIRCGRCQEVCPMGLPSGQLIRQQSDLLLDCIECGMCQYTCPAQQPILEEIRMMKSHLRDASQPDS